MSADNPRPIRIPKKKKGKTARDPGPATPAQDAAGTAATSEPASAAPEGKTPVNAPAGDATAQAHKPKPRKLPERRPAASLQPVSQPHAAEPLAATPHIAGEQLAATDEGWLAGLRQSLWTMPAWALSLLVHVIVLLALALVTAVVVESEPEVVISTSITGEDEPMEEFSEIEMEEPEELLEEEPLFEPDMPEMPKLTFDESAMAPSETVVNGEPTQTAATEGAAAEMADTAGSPKQGSESGKAVTFYGSKSKGNRFVFLIDNSPNMNNEGRMLSAFNQLGQAVMQMSSKQSFYVIFYSNRAYPLFFPDDTPEMVEATRKNKERLQQWLLTVELCDSRPTGSKALEKTLELAAELSPSTIFFLTDGDYAGTVTKAVDERPLGAPLNVIGLLPSKVTNQSERDAIAKLEKFQTLAEANDGTFTGVPSANMEGAPQLIERNRQSPGPVWGTYK